MLKQGREAEDVRAVLLDRNNGISAHIYDQSRPEEYALRQIEKAQRGLASDPDVEVTRLARLPMLEYEQERKDAAERLNVRASILDRLVAAEREKIGAFSIGTIITWVKPPPFGLGNYFRNSTEQILFATLGKTHTRPAAQSIPTHFEAPRGAHSEKPEKFYEIVRAASYPPYGEANQRTPRPDFINLFVEQQSLEAAE